MNGSNSTLNMQVQSRYLLNMAYLRIKNITVGDTLPSMVTKQINVNKLRIYASLENFFTFDHLGSLPSTRKKLAVTRCGIHELQHGPDWRWCTNIQKRLGWYSVELLKWKIYERYLPILIFAVALGFTGVRGC
jgi:hypothetical protein